MCIPNNCMECAYDKTCITKLTENKEEQENENENDRQNV